NKTPMQVEYICTIDHSKTFKIELKTGVDHCYVIRDVQAFLANVLSNEGYYFTKKFSYDPDFQYFIKSDLKIFEILYSMLTNEEVYAAEHDYYTSSTKKRTITIAPLIAHDLLNMLTERDCTIVSNGREFKPFDIKEDKL